MVGGERAGILGLDSVERTWLTTYMTKTQQEALDTIRANGTVYAYNGISHATVKVLERLGLVKVERSVMTGHSRRSGRNWSQLDWSVTTTDA